jgi:hypothetical protein
MRLMPTTILRQQKHCLILAVQYLLCIIVRGSLGLNEVQRGGPLLLLLSSFVTALVADARSLEFACKI